MWKGWYIDCILSYAFVFAKKSELYTLKICGENLIVSNEIVLKTYVCQGIFCYLNIENEQFLTRTIVRIRAPPTDLNFFEFRSVGGARIRTIDLILNCSFSIFRWQKTPWQISLLWTHLIRYFITLDSLLALTLVSIPTFTNEIVEIFLIEYLLLNRIF